MKIENEERERPADVVVADKLTKAIEDAIETARACPLSEQAEVLATLAKAIARVQKGLFYRRKGSAATMRAMAYQRKR